MKPSKLLLSIVFLTFAQLSFTQQLRVVSGTLVGADKMPIPGVSISIKGTATGTVTDGNGNYSIKVPLGATLEYSYIGFKKNEVVITLQNSQPAQPDSKEFPTSTKPDVQKSSFAPSQGLPESIEDAEDDTIGVARFTSSSPSFKVIDPNHPYSNTALNLNSKIASIDVKADGVSINIAKDRYLSIPHVTFFSSGSVEHLTKMPKLQHQFAQGRPENGTSQWRGPETGEFLSWGPAIQNLEYDGVANNFDKNGNIVRKGLGNGKSVQAYRPYDLFRTGLNLQNSLKIFEKYDKKEYSISYNNKQLKGIVPNSSKTGNYLDCKVFRKFRDFDVKAQVSFDDYTSGFMSSSPGSTMLMASIETTPPTFDNTNGTAPKKAVSNKSVYLLPDQTQRTYAPGISNNPYWLLNNMIDNEKNTVLNGSFESKYHYSRKIDVFVNGGIEHQKFTNSFGYRNQPAGGTDLLLTNRTDKLQTSQTSTRISYHSWHRGTDFSASLAYHFTNAVRSLARNDQTTSDATPTRLASQTKQNIHRIEFTSNANINNWFVANLSQNLSYNSLFKNYHNRYSPFAGIAFNIHEIPVFRYNLRPFNSLKIRSSWGYTFASHPLSFSYGSYNYQTVYSSNYAVANFRYEILPNVNLTPEKIQKQSVGLDMGLFGNSVFFNFDAYANQTSHGIFPRMETNNPIPENLANYTTKGVELELQYNFNARYNRHGSIRFIFSKNKSKVTSLEGNLDQVPLGGFTDVYTALVKDQPRGVIVGTAYKRNSQGAMIIGNDGYPMVDDKLHVLGDPNPNFTLGAEITFTYRDFTFSTLLDAAIGGKRWNGTENVLSYYGLSDKTIEGRKVLEYVFPGLKEDGTPNTTTVDFANPSKPIGENRWYRYGLTGVAEDALQDASYFRIKQISVTYGKFRGRVSKEISLFVDNPLLVTKYTGVNPEASLWGKSSTNGLDLFNFPSVSRIGISIRISI